jgi:hypothetical protein
MHPKSVPGLIFTQARPLEMGRCDKISTTTCCLNLHNAMHNHQLRSMECTCYTESIHAGVLSILCPHQQHRGPGDMSGVRASYNAKRIARKRPQTEHSFALKGAVQGARMQVRRSSQPARPCPARQSPVVCFLTEDRPYPHHHSLPHPTC